MKYLFSPQVPVLLIGAPGIGKTAQVQSHFDHSEVLLTSTLVEEDIAGLPYREGEYDYRTVPAIFRRLHDAAAEGKTTVLFLDELDKARRSVADTLLTLVASRRVGRAELPADTCIVAAANQPEFGGGDGISDAMLSRFTAVDCVPDVSNWADWADGQYASSEARMVVGAVRSGELPIFDMAGDGLSKRITTPRTLAMALSFMERKGLDSDSFDVVVRGLLTAATASQILHIVTRTKSDVMSHSVRNARHGIAQKTGRSVLRV
jgi:hypothetical protein